MERRDSGYCAEMDLPDNLQDVGYKGVIKTIPEAGQGIRRTLPVAYEGETRSIPDGDSSFDQPRNVPKVTVFQETDSAHTSTSTLDGSVFQTWDGDAAHNHSASPESSSSLTIHHEPEKEDGSDLDNCDQTMSPNDFIFWEEHRSSPTPKKALLKATLSLPLSPSYDASRPHSYQGKGSSFPFSIKEEDTDNSPQSSEGSLPPFRPRSRSLEKPKPVLSLPKPSKSPVTLGELKTILHQGMLWQADLSEGSKTEYWCVLQGDKFYIFESDHPDCQVEETWYLTDCEIGSVPHQMQIDLVKLSLLHSFQIKQLGKNYSAIFSAKEEKLCKTWIQKLLSVTSSGKKSKGSGLSFPQLSFKGRFTKSSNSFKNKNKDFRPQQMSKASFTDLYGWSEQQSHRRVHRTAPIQVKADRSQKANKGSPKQNRLFRANSDSELANKKSQDPIDRSNSAEPQPVSWRTQRDKFGSLRKTLAALPQLGGRTTQSTKKVQRPLTTTSSAPLEPSVKVGLLLVKRETSWKRCWLKIHGSSLHFYRNRNEMLPFEVLSLNGFYVHRNPTLHNSVGQVRFKFSLQSKEKGSIHFLADTEPEGKLWMKRFSEACTSSNMDTQDKTQSSILRKGNSGDYPEGYDYNFNDTSIHSDTSDSPTESPLLHQKRIMIHKKYQLANETEEMNAMKRSLILNQRRMSAQTKIDALDKQRLQRKAKGKNKKGKKNEPSEEEYDASVRALIEELRQKVADIDRNLNENVMRTDQRRQALLRKQEMELEILHQEKELLKYRTQAQNALKSMMLKAVVQNLSAPLTEERESDGDSPDSSSIVPVTLDGSYDDQHMPAKVMSNSVSSSLSSLSSNGTNESMGSLQNHTKLFSRNYPEQSLLSTANSESYQSNTHVSSPDLRTAHQDSHLSKRHSNVSSGDVDSGFQGVQGLLPDQDSFHTSDSDSVDIKLLSSEMKPKLRTEVPPDVLRDINEFEEMARLALQKAGWLPPSNLFLSN
ncbi:hypothetical protein HOLleu_38352 [Holothuria leucospilota]|uniref:PH domain-containing protein n=1 Tax=Holothuria leucospilota TaxID=206669 RepID=A0A9Q0YE64_HOLLE|nr:hypothetical protein HOLleu_38352 [Holothuria leucospilota]